MNYWIQVTLVGYADGKREVHFDRIESNGTVRECEISEAMAKEIRRALMMVDADYHTRENGRIK